MAGPTQDPFLWRKILILAAIVVLAAIATYVTVIVPRQDQHSGTAHGAALYAANCAGCHGQKLEGQADWHHLNAAGRLPAPPPWGARPPPKAGRSERAERPSWPSESPSS